MAKPAWAEFTVKVEQFLDEVPGDPLPGPTNWKCNVTLPVPYTGADGDYIEDSLLQAVALRRKVRYEMKRQARKPRE